MYICHSNWLLKSAKWSVARQSFGGRENAGEKKSGVLGVLSKIWKKQHGKFLDEVNDAGAAPR